MDYVHKDFLHSVTKSLPISQHTIAVKRIGLLISSSNVLSPMLISVAIVGCSNLFRQFTATENSNIANEVETNLGKKNIFIVT